MIVYEDAPAASVRAGELEVAGRRVAVRAFPYTGEVGLPRFRFDPVERRFISRLPQGVLSVGPHLPELWREALARTPPGPVLVGPGDPIDEIHGSFAAAAEGARGAGRSVYLLDPAPVSLPAEPGRVFVALFCFLPGEDASFDGIRTAARQGLSAGALLPLLPGWTVAPGVLEEAVRRAAGNGASFVAPLMPTEDGPARRALLEAHVACGASGAEDLFERIHHRDWVAELEDARERLADACSRAGLASIPPRPAGLGQPPGNAAAAARLEEKALASGRNEHWASLLHAAVRWIDESGRDLWSIVEEGNFRKIFPFEPDLAGEAEEAIRAASDRATAHRAVTITRDA